MSVRYISLKHQNIQENAVNETVLKAGNSELYAEHSTTLMLSRALSAVSGKGKVAYLMFLTDEEKKQVPEGIEVARSDVVASYGKDEECKPLFSLIFFHY